MIILTTERLILRHLEPDDLDALYMLYRDPDMRQFYPDGTLTREDTQKEIEWFLHGHPLHPELGLWAIVDRKTGEFLGRCGLLPWNIEGRDEVEVAFMIRKERWREGLATEAARGIIKHAREVLGLKRLVCLVVPGNMASAGVAVKLGMAMEREFTDEIGPSQLYTLVLTAA
jgi:ribosomal-protein-alanine N-acetyltransferase